MEPVEGNPPNPKGILEFQRLREFWPSGFFKFLIGTEEQRREKPQESQGGEGVCEQKEHGAGKNANFPRFAGARNSLFAEFAGSPRSGKDPFPPGWLGCTGIQPGMRSPGRSCAGATPPAAGGSSAPQLPRETLGKTRKKSATVAKTSAKPHGNPQENTSTKTEKKGIFFQVGFFFQHLLERKN